MTEVKLFVIAVRVRTSLYKDISTSGYVSDLVRGESHDELPPRTSGGLHYDCFFDFLVRLNVISVKNKAFNIYLNVTHIFKVCCTSYMSIMRNSCIVIGFYQKKVRIIFTKR